MEKNILCTNVIHDVSVQTRYDTIRLVLLNGQNVHETSKKRKQLSVEGIYTTTTSHCKLVKAKGKHLALEYFNVTVIWECSTCSGSHACTTRSVKALRLYENLPL